MTSEDEHALSMGRYQRGTQTFGNLRGAAGMQYGTAGRCSCGWTVRRNIAPSAGGSREVEQAHAHHVADELLAAWKAAVAGGHTIGGLDGWIQFELRCRASEAAAAEPEPGGESKVVDLMDQLERSVQAAREARDAHRRDQTADDPSGS